MKLVKVALFGIVVLLQTSCIKTKETYLNIDSSGNPIISKIIWFEKITPGPYVADSSTIVEVTIGIDPKTTKANNKIMLTTDDGIWFDNRLTKKEVQAGYNGLYTTTLLAYKPGKHLISAKIGDFDIHDTLDFEPACPEKIILTPDKISGGSDAEFLIDIDLSRTRGIVSNGLKIDIEAKIDTAVIYNSSSNLMSLNGKATVRIKNLYQVKGLMKIVARVGCNGISIQSNTIPITIN